jgi:S1-C subfamily serine protease
MGTAFCITHLANGQTVYVTARHVIDSLLDSDNTESFLLLPKNTSDPSKANDLVGVQIEQISTAASHCDVAMLRIDLRTAVVPIEARFRIFPLAFRQATIGQSTLAFGYSRMEVDQSGSTLLRDFRVSEGTVEEIHNAKRDCSLSTFPTFMTDALYLPGMSGGPVFNTTNGIIGVISHAILSEKGSAHCGYAASIAGLAELKIDLEQDDGTEREFTVPELLANGLISMAPQGGVTIDRSDSGVRLEWLPTDSETPPNMEGSG